MPVDLEVLITLYRDLMHENPCRRAASADSVTDIHRSFNSAEAQGVGSLLAVLAVWETNAEAREAQLNALSGLRAWSQVTPEIIAFLGCRTDRAILTGSQIEHIDYLLSDIP